MQITEKNINRKHKMLFPVGAKRIRGVAGIFKIRGIKDGQYWGHLREYVAGKLNDEFFP